MVESALLENIKQAKQKAEDKKRYEKIVKKSSIKHAEEAQELREQELTTQSAPVNYRTTVEERLKRILFDPYSVQIESINEPKRIFVEKDVFGLKAGQVAYLVSIEYNAKNKLGAYTGLQK